MMQHRSFSTLVIIACVIGLAGCAKTVVQPVTETEKRGLPRPPQVLVYTFAVSPTEVIENQSIIHEFMESHGDMTPEQRLREIGREAAEAMAEELVRGISELGLPARRAYKETAIPPNGLTVEGAFLDVDQGNRMRRIVVGFGSGSARVDARVLVHQVGPDARVKLLDFMTHGDSGKLPGAAVTMGAGAAAQGGATAGMAAANVAVSGVKIYRSEHEQMAARSAEQAVAYLSQFFAKEGWIIQAKVKEVKLEDK
ncbi:MAG: hypothetical protein AUI03_08900 [Nitrospirae bacterium 13_2_20CM_2_62_8]|nr:MAG: hypothetical protein AUI03_08900 [Nitrospirae bacterium 13_2_20CM_2_62_8]